ncbi:hypothetical protein [Actinosynnema sp. NPDC023587]|uniref:hypothetical protein n=1 Tax=Actinosynnema sp. NPDC023587 TaxID=3154695 RepID=UPI0033EB7D48
MNGPAVRWISEPGARELRASCTRLGAVLIAAAVVLAALLVAVGLSLSTYGNALNAIAWPLGVMSTLPLLLSGVVLANARAHVRGEHLDLAGARKARRGLAVLWVCTCLSALFAAGARLDATRFGPQDRALLPADWIYLLLLATAIVLGGVAFTAGRTLFRTTPPAR